MDLFSEYMNTQEVLNELLAELKSNATLICVAAFILFMAWHGYKKGFMTMLLSLGSVVVTLIVDYLLLAFCMEKISEIPVIDAALDRISWQIVMAASGINSEDFQAEGYLLSDNAQNLVKEIIIFIVIFIIMQIVLRTLMAAVRKMKNFRFIDWVDSVLGAVFGIAEGVIFVWIFMLLLSLWSGSAFGAEIYRQIFRNELLRFLFFLNPVSTFLERLLT